MSLRPNAQFHEVIYLLPEPLAPLQAAVPDAQDEPPLRDMRYSDFLKVARDGGKIKRLAGRRMRLAYARLSETLALRLVICVRIAFDAEGALAEEWRLPIDDLVRTAGPGPDLGTGPVRLVCKGQCSIPWLTPRLWLPNRDARNGDLVHMQALAWRNRLGLRRDGVPAAAVPTGRPNLLDPLRARDPSTTPVATAQRDLDAMRDKLDAALGDTGSISVRQLASAHSQRIKGLVDDYRKQLEEQHAAHTKQMRQAREEISRLQTRLQREQERREQLENLLARSH